MDKTPILTLLSQIMKPERAATLCDELYASFGTTERIMRANGKDLMNVKDVDEATASYLPLLCALASRRRCEAFRFGSVFFEPAFVRYLSGLFLGVGVECVYVFSIDSEGRVIAGDLLSRGTVNTSNVNVRLALELALRAGAREVIVAHNHPGGVSTPSMDDLQTTNLLSSAYRSVGIRLRAHYIVALDSYEIIGEGEIPAEMPSEFAN